MVQAAKNRQSYNAYCLSDRIESIVTEERRAAPHAHTHQRAGAVHAQNLR